jgi:hypothetical protein
LERYALAPHIPLWNLNTPGNVNRHTSITEFFNGNKNCHLLGWVVRVFVGRNGIKYDLAHSPGVVSFVGTEGSYLPKLEFAVVDGYPGVNDFDGVFQIHFYLFVDAKV